MTFYDVLCQWNKETEIVIKCRKLSWHVANCRDVCRKLSWQFFSRPLPAVPFWISPIKTARPPPRPTPFTRCRIMKGLEMGKLPKTISLKVLSETHHLAVNLRPWFSVFSSFENLNSGSQTSEVSKRGWRTEGVSAKKSREEILPMPSTLLTSLVQDRTTMFWASGALSNHDCMPWNQAKTATGSQNDFWDTTASCRKDPVACRKTDAN